VGKNFTKKIGIAEFKYEFARANKEQFFFFSLPQTKRGKRLCPHPRINVFARNKIHTPIQQRQKIKSNI
jgi:hypothetical protein